MCFSIRANRKSKDQPTLRRRLTINAANGVRSVQALKRAVDLALFISPTKIHFHGDGTVNGKRDIYLSAGIQKHLRKQYDHLRRYESCLTREQFANFLITAQGEVEPKLSKDSYTYEEFLEVWWLQFGLEALKPIRAADKDLTKPISNYFISSSHNTYLPGNQLSGKSSANEYRKVLLRGCRCVEIDVWDGDSPGSSPDGTLKMPSKPEHTRHLSGSSLHSAAATFVDQVGEKIEHAKHLMADKKVHNRSPSSTQAELAAPSLSRESGTSLDSATGTTKLDDIHPHSRSRQALYKHEPIVMHGYTLTAPVAFREVCVAVRESAFKKTSLPIIVSLEVHCDFEQQELMVQIMKEEWAGLLVEKPHDTCPKNRMPRLEELQNKILVKVKKAASKTETAAAVVNSFLPIGTLEDEAAWSDDERTSSSTAVKKPKVPICENLSALAVYTHSEHFKTFESQAAKVPSHIFSISENRILELYQTKRKEMFHHNRHFFMRAFPKGLRFDSSNPDPSLFWRKGVQMVALNWQYWEEAMMLNEGMFAGEDGWVLKPPGYRSDDETTLSIDTLPHHTLDLRIAVLAGQHIPLPEGANSGSGNTRAFRPYVKCELHVEKQEERPNASGEGPIRPINRKQQTLPGKTDHPDFGSHKNMFEFISIPGVVDQLSFVRFKVEDAATRLARSIKGDQFTAWACIRLDRLQPGYRFINLLDPKGNPTQGQLLVRIDKALR
ncbi:PLC-like phosphodiesterase [Xylariales sp. PMI_506]|nr:PLC-like phosphodiesterase [Xylariales sp. PMI_506]